MQVAIQHRTPTPPSIHIALAAVSVAVVVLALALSESRTHSISSEDIVATPGATSQPLNVSRSPAIATRTDDTATQDVLIWPSDIMDSHDSVQSLAALAKSNSNNADRPHESSVSTDSGLALFAPTAPEQTR